MIQWYKDPQKKAIDPELLDGRALAEAKKWVDKKFTSTQLRKYFNEVKHLERQLIILKTQDNDSWNNVFPMVKMLKSRISYDKNRKNSNISDGFKKFIDDSVNSISRKEDFLVFLKYFEASVGFFTEVNKENEKN